MAKHEMWELRQMQSLPLQAKIQMTRVRIRAWIDEYGTDGVYVSFSGGKDSTVLLDIVRKDYPNVKAVFIDTGLEYPEIREFVKTFTNVDWLRPKMNFKQVIEKYGYPFISKEVSECVYGARKYLKSISGGGNERYKYRYEKLCGQGKYTQYEQGGADNKWRKLRGIAEYSKSRQERDRICKENIGRVYKKESNDDGEYP